jgi:lysyl endopeptidase
MNKLIAKLLVFMALNCTLNAQTARLGNPKSWELKNTNNREIPVHIMPSFDLHAQLRADAINEANKIGPWRFGYEHNVNFGLNNGGLWIDLPNGDRIWRISFVSDGALSMNVLFDKFNIPEGATVYLYNKERTQFDGAYTHANNNSDEILGSSILKGANLTVEYYEPATVKGQGKLNIGTVIHGYKSLSLYAEDILKGLNDAGKCNHDVKCPLGNGWQNQINSVAIIIVGGSGACTGALVNNTAQDGTPYFLSADHCGTTGLGNWVFRFNWDSPNAVCAQNAASSDPGAPFNQVNGASLRANRSGSDFCLMRLNATPTGNIYYAGWDRSTTPATQVTGIHHPSGDVKKISRENQAVNTANWSGAQTWEVNNWDLGTTEPGSSGSPLFDQNQRIIGQLYGGGAACSGLTNNNQSDYYGRFDISWTGGGTNSTRLSNWLDPANTGQIFIDGYDPNASTLANDAGVQQIVSPSGSFCNQSVFTPVINLKNFGTSSISSATISYNLDGATNSTFNWSGSLASNASTTVSLPSVTVSTGGAHVFNATVTLPNGQVDSNAVNNAANSTFFVVLNGQSVNLDLTTDSWGSEISWEITNNSGFVVDAGGPYPDGTPNTAYNSILCLSPGCYTFTIFDSYGDGLFDGQNSGNYTITDSSGTSVVQSTVANFGDSISHNFCIGSVPSSVNNISGLTNLNIFPNPSSGTFNLNATFSQNTDAELSVSNALGQVLFSRQLNNEMNYNEKISMDNFAKGLYYVQLKTGSEIITRKVILK